MTQQSRRSSIPTEAFMGSARSVFSSAALCAQSRVLMAGPPLAHPKSAATAYNFVKCCVVNDAITHDGLHG